MDRRHFLKYFINGSAFTCVIASYAYFASLLMQFFYSGKSSRVKWTFVSTLDELKKIKTMGYVSPIGETITLTFEESSKGAESYRALSSTCPHLGCQVFWQGAKKQFFCPCHNGIFDASGNPLEGPPAQAKQKLLEYPIRVKMGLVFIQVPTEKLVNNSTTHKQCQLKA